MTDKAARGLQQVVPINDRVRCTDWMELDRAFRGSKGLYVRTVDFFPALFRSSDRRVNLNKARDQWKKREQTAVSLAKSCPAEVRDKSKAIRRQFVVKTLGGHGKKLGTHWMWLYPLLLAEFQRLRRAGVKNIQPSSCRNLSNHLVAEIGIVFIEDNEHPMFNVRYSVKGTLFADLMTPRQVQGFLKRNNIVYWSHKGKKQVSVEKQMQIDIAVVKHLGALKRQFEDGTLLPDQQYNMDESHFVFDLDDGRTWVLSR
ncbi:hypothetical protein PHMEG_00017132 [Phytophthora megakarya]|uniref:Uncharacterized protein n=1 Tax=Phytophthora megakarya TaxID=4795 RepID=A0A225VZN4_9STRA|nr:hypothetical protein PHMEG_00017132 [Phytophthora megakarya]